MNNIFRYWRCEKNSFEFFTRNCKIILVYFSFNLKKTQYNTLNVKLSNSQLSRSKPAIKYGAKVTLDFSSNINGDSNDENNFPHKSLLTNTQVSKLCKVFANNSSANIKLSNTLFHKTEKIRMIFS